MAANKIDLANAIRSSINMYRGLSEFADALEDSGKLEQTNAELTAANDKLAKQKAESLEQLEAVQDEIKAAESRAQVIVKAGLAQANEAVTKATNEATAAAENAKQRIKAFEKKTAESIDARTNHAQKMVTEAQAALEEAKEAERKSKAELAKHKRELSGILAKKEEVKAQLQAALN